MSATGAEESADTLGGPRGDCKAYQKCISTIFDNFGGKINQKMVVSNFFSCCLNHNRNHNSE